MVSYFMQAVLGTVILCWKKADYTSSLNLIEKHNKRENKINYSMW